MKKILIIIVTTLTSTYSIGQKTADFTFGTFTSLRNKDFTQLIGASTPGISLNFNSDKATINGSFTIKTIHQNTAYPIWIQLQPSLGTTTTLFTLGDDVAQPEFSLSSSITFISFNRYYYDGTFSDNYGSIKGDGNLDNISTNSDFYYTQSLREKLQEKETKLKPTDRLYTAKKINWITVLPELGGSKYTYFDKNRSFTDQIYKPYYNLWGVSASYNHYWYVNNDDVRWDGWPVTRFFYYKISFRYGTNNNTDVLKKTSINDVSNTIINSAMNTTRQIVKSTSAYSGVYENYESFSPSFEVLYSFAKIFAFDFFGSYNLITSKSTSTSNNGNLAAGLYFYTSNTGSKVNIGVYYQRTFDNNSVKEIIGLKSKVPINW